MYVPVMAQQKISAADQIFFDKPMNTGYNYNYDIETESQYQ